MSASTKNFPDQKSSAPTQIETEYESISSLAQAMGIKLGEKITERYGKLLDPQTEAKKQSVIQFYSFMCELLTKACLDAHASHLAEQEKIPELKDKLLNAIKADITITNDVLTLAKKLAKLSCAGFARTIFHIAAEHGNNARVKFILAKQHFLADQNSMARNKDALRLLKAAKAGGIKVNQEFLENLQRRLTQAENPPKSWNKILGGLIGGVTCAMTALILTPFIFPFLYAKLIASKFTKQPGSTLSYIGHIVGFLAALILMPVQMLYIMSKGFKNGMTIGYSQGLRTWFDFTLPFRHAFRGVTGIFPQKPPILEPGFDINSIDNNLVAQGSDAEVATPATPTRQSCSSTYMQSQLGVSTTGSAKVPAHITTAPISVSPTTLASPIFVAAENSQENSTSILQVSVLPSPG